MAREAERLLDGSGWLPEPLRLAVDEASAVGAETAADDGTEGTGDDAPSEDEVPVLPAFLTDETAEPNESAPQEHFEAAE
ncbi:hypothetical protein CO652_23500 [Rhizobium sp. H4]|uniref:hypothetical protein n=1 Tax=Rhizobium sp. H4 TaxID=2035449 RepID=UPI000BEA5C89|nr:hypothetical protein [Rhizobium sp. H4]PDV86112.1 hypothetical protein CO652_23500 [Rhizobium sp. H4]